MTKPFVHLRCLSSYSLSESTLKIKKLIGLAKEKKMPALAITDTNNMFGALEFSIKCFENGCQWDGLGGYTISGQDPYETATYFDDENSQVTGVWKVIIDLSHHDYWMTKEFNIVVSVKSSGTSYIYGNQTGQIIFKVTGLLHRTSVDDTGVVGIRTDNI